MKILRQNSNSHKGVELWAKTERNKKETISGISDAIFPARHPRKSSQHVRACAAGDGAICSKNRKIVPYHGVNPNTRNGASPSPIMAPGLVRYIYSKIDVRCRCRISWNNSHSSINRDRLLRIIASPHLPCLAYGWRAGNLN